MGGHITQAQADEYAIGSLDTEMERLITLHAADCTPCRELLFEAERVASSLAMSAPPRTAPPRLKKKVAVQAGIRPPGPTHYLIRFGQAAAGFAAVLVAVAALTGMLSMRSQVSELRQQNAELRSEVRNLASQEVEIFALSIRLAEAEQRAAEIARSAERDRELWAAMASPDSDTAEVVAVEGREYAIGRLVWEQDQNRLWFVAQNLPELDEGHSYQLWLDDGGEFIPLGRLQRDDSGTATYVRHMPNGISSYNGVIVTIERSGGSFERRGDAIFFVTNLPRPQ
jgi:anti-sigma-K factor RskA